MRNAAAAMRRLIAATGALLVAGCALLTPLPEPRGLDERLAAFPAAGLPFERPVTIHWDEHQVPFIEAETDRDLAFALGLVHAHLRLGQMEILRRISQGRIAEMGGPLAVDIDHALRILDFGRGVDATLDMMPAETGIWLEAFVGGVNHYAAHMSEPPHEFEVLGIEAEPWSVRDVLRVGRLAGTDVNWIVWFALLDMRANGYWDKLWPRLVEAGRQSIPSFAPSAELAVLQDLFAATGKSGSNTVAVAGARSASGGALIASDPHLGLHLPNLWLLAGMKSPSHHAVGMMVPGLPLVAVGRNPWIAWGGTNLRAASSDLYDLSRLPPGAIRERTETIRVRWWLDEEVTVRESDLGPVISDVPQLALGEDREPIALRWIGHEGGDEVTAMLAVARARDFDEFRDAFAPFAVSGQNMLYADAEGNIGQVIATWLPDRPYAVPPALVLDGANPGLAWRGRLDATQLPAVYNPKEGYIASANNRPTEAGPPVGWFFSPDDRVVRLQALLAADDRVTAEALGRLQRDVIMPSSVPLRDAILARARELGLDGEKETAPAVAALAGWDGAHDPGSAGPLALEVALEVLMERRLDDAERALFRVAAGSRTQLADTIAADPAERIASSLREALAAASKAVAEHGTWGAVHRLALSHPLAFLPVVGSAYRFAEWPVGGGQQTVMKTAHGAPGEPHDTRYGSQARHISDMADPDANWFVLLGGQDGWIGSSTFMDQAGLWREGAYVHLPLRPETVQRSFARRMVLAPGG